MQDVTTTTQSETVTGEVVIGHVARVEGKTATERRVSIVQQASTAATMALVADRGAAGKTARANIAFTGLDAIATAASHANYRPVAEYFAAELGESFVVRRRADFEALPSRMEELVLKAKRAKNGGMRTDKKTGVQVPGATLARALRLHGVAVNLVATANAKFAERVAAAVEKSAE